MKRFMLLFAGIVGILALSQKPAFCEISVISISSVTASSGTATVTISSPVATSYSSGLYTYITHYRIELYATTTFVAGATPITCTTTNLSSKVFKLPSAMTAGTVNVIDIPMEHAAERSVNPAINTVVSCPATNGAIWNIAVNYYQAP